MDRYARNIELKEITQAGQDKLLQSKVLICGCGGLGSTVIANLCGLGIGNVGLVDSDAVELSNLNRQFIHKYENVGKEKVLSALEWIKEYNPNINVQTYNVKMDNRNYSDITDGYDIIVDCFDSYASKFLLNDIAIKMNKILIHGGVSAFYGQVTTIIPKKTACLRCFMPDADLSEAVPKGIVSPAVSTIGSIQSMEILKSIINIGEPLTDILLTYDGKKAEFKKLKLCRNPKCCICR